LTNTTGYENIIMEVFMKIDYNEMRMWVDNDEGLYNWWKSSRQPISTFIKENAKEIRLIIRKVLS
jgi:hypothetical protein